MSLLSGRGEGLLPGPDTGNHGRLADGWPPLFAICNEYGQPLSHPGGVAVCTGVTGTQCTLMMTGWEV